VSLQAQLPSISQSIQNKSKVDKKRKKENHCPLDGVCDMCVAVSKVSIYVIVSTGTGAIF